MPENYVTMKELLSSPKKIFNVIELDPTFLGDIAVYDLRSIMFEYDNSVIVVMRKRADREIYSEFDKTIEEVGFNIKLHNLEVKIKPLGPSCRVGDYYYVLFRVVPRDEIDAFDYMSRNYKSDEFIEIPISIFEMTERQISEIMAKVQTNYRKVIDAKQGKDTPIIY